MSRARHFSGSSTNWLPPHLQHEEYNEAVLNHLFAAFQFITPFTDTQQSFSSLISQVSTLTPTGSWSPANSWRWLISSDCGSQELRCVCVCVCGRCVCVCLWEMCVYVMCVCVCGACMCVHCPSVCARAPMEAQISHGRLRKATVCC